MVVEIYNIYVNNKIYSFHYLIIKTKQKYHNILTVVDIIVATF